MIMSDNAVITSILTNIVRAAETSILRSSCLIAIVVDIAVRTTTGKNPKNQIQLDTVVEATKTRA